jgi:predicted ribosome quality control (RQC) complex YloA/Tae2 family protein
MIFDSTLLAAVIAELRPFCGERLRDIWQQADAPRTGRGAASTAADETGSAARAVYLSFREGTLLIDTHPQQPRLHVVNNAPAPPRQPTALTDLLRKTLRGARLLNITQPNFDRVARLEFQSRNAIGDLTHYTVVAELMERRANLILLDSDGIIIDAVKRLPPFLNRARTILPHRPYEPPPSAKENPLEVKDWTSALDSSTPADSESAGESITAENLPSRLRARFSGISPLVLTALDTVMHAASENTAALTPMEACAWFFERARRAADGDFTPVCCGEQPYPFGWSEDDCQPAEESLNALLEKSAARGEMQRSLQGERAALLAHLARREKLNAAQHQDVAKALRHAAAAETFKKWGNLLLAHISQVEAAAQRGATWVELPDPESDIYSPDVSGESVASTASTAVTASSDFSTALRDSNTLRIAIEPKWTAADNAAAYFKRYRRAQKLGTDAPQRMADLDTEAAQLAQWRALAQAAHSSEELAEVARACSFEKRAATKAGMTAKSRTKQQDEAARPESKLRRREYEGWQLWMGRSAEENQTLLSKVASPSDIWMHVRGMPSAHVLVKNQKGQAPPPKVLQEAARWVASSGRSSGRGNNAGERVEVIYTPAKWVRAVKGSPGRVTLQQFRTLLIETGEK